MLSWFPRTTLQISSSHASNSHGSYIFRFAIILCLFSDAYFTQYNRNFDTFFPIYSDFFIGDARMVELIVVSVANREKNKKEERIAQRIMSSM